MRAVALLVFFFVGGLAWAQADPAIVQKLRDGGYVLYMRHAATDFRQSDANMRSFDDCASQRNLTDKGRDDARAVGSSIARLGIPIGWVLASPYCRTMETARLAFGKAEPTNDVRGGPASTPDRERYAGLRRLLGSVVPKGQDLVIVSHGNPFHAVAGPPYLAEGEIAVIEPDGDGEHFKIISRIRPGDWPALRAGAGRAS